MRLRTAVTALLALLLALELCPLGLPGFEVYRYRDLSRFAPDPALLVRSAFLGLLILAAPRIRRAALLLPLLAAASVALGLSLYTPLPLSWTWRIISISHPETNPFFAQGISIRDARDYPRLHATYSLRDPGTLPTSKLRLRHYPPGLPLLYHAVDRLAAGSPTLERLALGQIPAGERSGIPLPAPGRAAAAASLAALLHLAALALIPVCTWLLAREVSGPEAAGPAAAASCLIPAFHLFAVEPDLLLVPLATLLVWAWMRAVRTSSAAGALASGALAALGLFLSFTLLPLLPLLAWLGRKSPRMALTALAGLLATSLVLNLGANPLGGLVAAFLAPTSGGRPYLPSLPFNALEFLVFGGAWAAGLGLSRGLPFRSALTGLALLLLLSGGARGEVSRIWMFLMPATLCAVLEDPRTRTHWRWLAEGSLLLGLLLSARVETSLAPWMP